MSIYFSDVKSMQKGSFIVRYDLYSWNIKDFNQLILTPLFFQLSILPEYLMFLCKYINLVNN